MTSKTSHAAPDTTGQAENLRLLEIKCKIVQHLVRIPNAAELAGMTVNGLRKAIKQGLIGVYQIDDELFVHRQDVSNYQPSSASGRPRSRKARQ